MSCRCRYSYFFDQVNHKLLMQQVLQLVGDKDILRLIRSWLTMFVVDGDKRYRLTKHIRATGT